MLSLVQPRFFVPVHGEYRQLAYQLAVSPESVLARSAQQPMDVLVAENGDVMQFGMDFCRHRREGADGPRSDRRHARG